MSRADWGPWRVRVTGVDCDLHLRRGKGGVRRCQVRVWRDGRVLAIAEGRTPTFAWFYLALGCAGRAAKAGVLLGTDDAGDDGSCDPVPT